MLSINNKPSLTYTYKMIALECTDKYCRHYIMKKETNNFTENKLIDYNKLRVCNECRKRIIPNIQPKKLF